MCVWEESGIHMCKIWNKNLLLKKMKKMWHLVGLWFSSSNFLDYFICQNHHQPMITVILAALRCQMLFAADAALPWWGLLHDWTGQGYWELKLFIILSVRKHKSGFGENCFCYICSSAHFLLYGSFEQENDASPVTFWSCWSSCCCGDC